MTCYYDVRFKYPWSVRGYSTRDRVAFDQLLGYKHFFVGINPNRTFNYLRSWDEAQQVWLEPELDNISYAGLEAHILWRLSTPVQVLNSMALACLGLRGARDNSEPPTIYRQRIADASFLADFSRVPLKDFDRQKVCLMLVEQHLDRDSGAEPSRRELIFYSCG